MQSAPLLVIEGILPTRTEMRGVSGIWTDINRWNGLAALALAAAFMVLLPAILSGDGLYRALALLGVPLSLVFVMLRSRGARRWQEAILKTPLFNPAPSWSFDLQGFEIANEHQSNRVSWSAVTFIEEADRLVFAVGPNTMWVVPRRLLTAEQSARLSTIIAAAVADSALCVDSPPPPSDNPRS